MSLAELFWDRISRNYDESTDRFEKNHAKTVEHAKKYLAAGDVVLDFGCATGTVAVKIAGCVKKYYGIDISSRMIDAAKRRAAEHRIKNIDFAQSTIFSGRYARESFSVILAFNVLHLLKDAKRGIERINELLKPGGLIISVTPCLGENKSAPMNIIFSLLTLAGIYLKSYQSSEIEDLIEEGNFQALETESFFHDPPNPFMSRFIVAKKRR